MKLQRHTTSHGSMCDAAEVGDLEAKCAELEAKYAELGAKCAELEKQLEGYTEAFDCIRDAMLFAERAIADPDSVAVVVMPDVVEEPLNAEMLDIIESLHYCSEYWSGYDVPIGIVERMNKVIAQAKGDNHG